MNSFRPLGVIVAGFWRRCWWCGVGAAGAAGAAGDDGSHNDNRAMGKVGCMALWVRMMVPVPHSG